MLKLILHRIAWFIPTVLVVLGLTFCLVKISPGDPVHFYVDTENTGIQSRANYYDLYNQTADFLGLNRPDFYFSLSPHRIDENLYNWPFTLQKLAKSCLRHRYSWNDTRHLIQQISDLLISDSFNLEDQLELQELILEQKPDRIVVKLSTHIQTITGEEALKELSSSTGGPNSIRDWRYYLPKWHWHGLNNQFHAWFLGALTFDFGSSNRDGQKVNAKLWQAIQWTVCINLTSLVIAYLLAIPIGVYSGWYTHSWLDRLSNVVFTIFYAIPIFWMATILVVFFTTSEYGKWTNVFPVAGMWMADMGDSFFSVLKKNYGKFFIPVITLSTALLAFITRQVRGSIANEKKATYIFQARAKGLRENKIIWSHAFKNASFPLITMLASLLPSSIAGALVLEIICNIPGIGNLLYNSIFNQDWPVLMGVVGITAWLTMIGLLLSDIVYRIVDPRLQEESHLL